MTPQRILKGTKAAVWRAFDGLGLEVRLKSSRLRPWDDPAFLAAYGRVRDRITMPPERCYRLYELARHVRTLPGGVAECGSYRGATARFLSELLPDRELDLFDTFEGFPDVDTSRDGTWKAGDFGSTSAADVARYLQGTRAELHPGRVPETLAAVADKRFCFVHLDMDLYEPTRAALPFFHSRMVGGGCILIDDYGLRTGRGIEPAVREFAAEIAEQPIYFFTGQCLIVRHCGATRGATGG
jgi:O-methyltransferase